MVDEDNAKHMPALRWRGVSVWRGEAPMTPFGQRVRALRVARGMTMKTMAAALEVSPAYLSALEHGRKGRPSPVLVRQICALLDIIWDEADELLRLAELSHPRIVVDTAALSPLATELANKLAERIRHLDEGTVAELIARLDAVPIKRGRKGRRKRPPGSRPES